MVDDFEDFDVGQTSAAVSSTATGTGTLVMNNVGTLDIGKSFDIGQAGGSGRATAIAMVTIDNVATMTVGTNMDVGRTNGSNGAGNSGHGIVNISDADIRIGYAVPLEPGSLTSAGFESAPGPQSPTAATALRALSWAATQFISGR